MSNDGVIITSNTGLTEEERNMFATGISANDSSEETENIGKLPLSELNNEIEEHCPVTASASRSDIDYGEFVHGTYFSEICDFASILS